MAKDGADNMRSTMEEMLTRKSEGKCPFCGKKVTEDELRNELSKREFEISGLCQKCQDEVYGYD